MVGKFIHNSSTTRKYKRAISKICLGGSCIICVNFSPAKCFYRFFPHSFIPPVLNWLAKIVEFLFLPRWHWEFQVWKFFRSFSSLSLLLKEVLLFFLGRFFSSFKREKVGENRWPVFVYHFDFYLNP